MRWALILGLCQATVPFSIADDVTFGGQLERPSSEKVQSFAVEAQSALADYAFPLPRSQSAEALKKNREAEATPGDPAFSWRLLGITTPARQQDRCASCYAFTAVGALEANWALRNGVQIDASEQHVLNCAAGSCSSGGLLSDAMTFLVKNGTTSESDEPYQGGRFSCAVKPIRFQAKARRYVSNGGGVPSDGELKLALLEHGPIAVFIYAAGLDAPAYYKTDRVIADKRTGNDHFVLIVGWDDKKIRPHGKGAWEIKNSWGTTWGHNGFGWVAYGVRDIGDNAMWIECAGRTTNSVPDPFGDLKRRPLPEAKVTPPVADN